MEKKQVALALGGAFVIAAGAAFGISQAVSGGSSNTGSSTPLAGQTQGLPSASAVPSSSPTGAVNGAVAGFPAGGNYCLIGRSGDAVQVYLYNGPGGYQCPSFSQALAQQLGGFWQAEGRNLTLSPVCAMNSGDQEAIVMDEGSEIFGQGVCSYLQTNGWVEDTEAEQEIQAGQAQASAAAAAAQASASQAAAVAASQSAAAADLENAASGDLYNLTNDVHTFPDYTPTVQQVVTQSAADLKQEKADAAAGAGSGTSGEGCVGVANAVYNDAVSALYNDQQSGLLNAVDGLAGAISTARTAIETVQKDQAQLQAAGLSGTSGASAEISAAQAQISSVIKSSNSAIDTVAGDVSAGYALADQVLTGSCSGAGISAPGNAPAPPAQLS